MTMRRRDIEAGDDPFAHVDDVAELRRMAAYFRNLADDNGARLLKAEASASRNRQELEQKTRGFSLLSRLSYEVSATEEPAFVARIVTGHLNGMLNMNRSVVLLRNGDGSFGVLGAAGYGETERQGLAGLRLHPPKAVARERRVISTLAPSTQMDRAVFDELAIRYFMAVPVIADDQVKAVIVTGRMRERLPFLPPLNSADLETVSAISGFFGAYLARHSLILRDRERINDVERLVVERTAEIERQRGLLDDSLHQLRETQQQLVLREKLASLGQLMAGVAHEIRNPLNFINNFSELSSELAVEIEEMMEPVLEQVGVEAHDALVDTFAMLRSNLERIATHGRRADNIVNKMLQHSRGDSYVAEGCDLNALLTESIDFALASMRSKDPLFEVAVFQDFDPALGMVTLAPQEISRVFVNLLSNAFYALSQRRAQASAGYSPSMVVSTRRKNHMVEVRLRDNGVGMSAEIKEHIFTPFFSTKPTGEGTGLGLSLSYDIIVNGLGGAIEVDSRENEFCEFVICLPV